MTGRAATLRAFYVLKPFIPRPVQVTARRFRANRIWERLDGTVVPSTSIAPEPFPWPAGKTAAALVTHDVEHAIGQDNVRALVDIEDSFGVKSCWNFVVKRYAVDRELMKELQLAGHEVGVHGVYHDGKLFDNPDQFQERLATMVKAAADWGAAGFRSPSLIYDPLLLRTVPFSWDSSMPAWDPFQPKPGDCLRYFPFLLNEHCVELPVTLWQDFTLFEELRHTGIEVWRRQIDFVHALGGLITVIVHPDYMLTPARQRLYAELLAYIQSKPGVWLTTPTAVAGWAREVARTTVGSARET